MAGYLFSQPIGCSGGVLVFGLSYEKICVLVLWQSMCVCGMLGKEQITNGDAMSYDTTAVLSLSWSRWPFLHSSVSGLGDLKAYLRRAVKTSFHLFNYSGD